MRNSGILSACLILAFSTAVGHAQATNSPKSLSLAASISASGGGNSYSPLFSADGRSLVFLSQANNLSTNDSDTIFWSDVFVYDLTTGTTTLVSVNASGTGGGNGNSYGPVVSSNGQFIAFQSAASNLTTNDNNGTLNIYVRDIPGKTTRLVSISQIGSSSGNGRSSNPQITSNGRWIAFESEATNLVAGDSNGAKDIFVRDLQFGSTYLASFGGIGAFSESLSPSLSSDAQHIAFSSNARFFPTNLTYSESEIYVRDRTLGATIWASSNIYYLNAAAHRTYRAFFPVLSTNGLLLAFKSEPSPSQTPNSANLFYHDLQTGNTTLISSNVSNGTFPEMTPDGRFVAYEAGPNVYVWDSVSKTNTLVSVDLTGTMPPAGTSLRPVMTGDGTKVAFLSDAPNLTTNGNNGTTQLYLRDLVAGVTYLISTRLDNTPADDLSSIRPDMSADGLQVAFESSDEHLVPEDQNQSLDIFLRNIPAGTTQLISTRHPDMPSRTSAGRPFLARNSLSADSRFAAFTSLDSTLVMGDRNNAEDAFVRDIFTKTNIPLARIVNGVFETNASTLTPVMSAGGQFAAYVRRVLSDNPPVDQIFLFDLVNKTSQLASRRWFDGTGGSGRSSLPSISRDGYKVAFQSEASDLVPQDSNGSSDVFVFDSINGSNILVSVKGDGTGSGNSLSINPVISPDGRWVVFQSKATDLTTNVVNGNTFQLFCRDLVSNATALVSMDQNGSGFAGSDPSFDPGSRIILLSGPANQAFLYDLNARTNSLICTNCINPAINANLQWLVFETVPEGTAVKNIILKNLQTGVTNLVSINTSGTGGGNGSSYAPSITHDGQFIVFLSRASDLVGNDTNGWTDVFVRDRLNNTTVIATLNQSGSPGNGPSYNLVLGADGRTVTFQSYACDLESGDFNNNQDIYFLRLSAGDSDGDGMDDDWELAYFGTLARDGTGDFDGDGQSDLKEFLAGTDPTNSGSVFRVIKITSLNGTTTLLWNATPGKKYQVQYKDNVGDIGWSNFPTLTTATGSTASAVDPAINVAIQRYYRVLLVP